MKALDSFYVFLVEFVLIKRHNAVGYKIHTFRLKHILKGELDDELLEKVFSFAALIASMIFVLFATSIIVVSGSASRATHSDHTSPTMPAKRFALQDVRLFRFEGCGGLLTPCKSFLHGFKGGFVNERGIYVCIEHSVVLDLAYVLAAGEII